MPDLSIEPRDQFQRYHQEQRLEWSQMVTHRTLQLAFTYALADMGSLAYSREEMRGANLFIHHVLNLSKEQVPVTDRYPAQPLQDETKPKPA